MMMKMMDILHYWNHNRKAVVLQNKLADLEHLPIKEIKEQVGSMQKRNWIHRSSLSLLRERRWWLKIQTPWLIMLQWRTWNKIKDRDLLKNDTEVLIGLKSNILFLHFLLIHFHFPHNKSIFANIYSWIIFLFILQIHYYTNSRIINFHLF